MTQPLAHIAMGIDEGLQIFDVDKVPQRVYGVLTCDQLNVIRTPYGDVVAFTNRLIQSTVISDYFVKEVTPPMESIAKRMIVRPVPAQQQAHVTSLRLSDTGGNRSFINL